MKRNYVIETIQYWPAAYRFGSDLRQQIGRWVGAREYPEIEGRVHFNDLMLFRTPPSEYARVGNAAGQIILEALGTAGKSAQEVQSVLDYGCGYGRVTRVLAREFGNQKVTVLDANDEGAQFCAAEFGVKYIPFNPDLEKMVVASYDVIWLGSVFTHLSELYTKNTFQVLSKLLAPGGVLVFSAHGEESLKRLESGAYGRYYQSLSPQIIHEFRTCGFSFIPYRHYADQNIGMTWMSKEYIDRILPPLSSGRLHRIDFRPAVWERWDNHQDIHVWQG